MEERREYEKKGIKTRGSGAYGSGLMYGTYGLPGICRRNGDRPFGHSGGGRRKKDRPGAG